MPELPDILTYIDALRLRIIDHTIERITIKSPFFLRSFDPPIDAACGCRVLEVTRLGKRLVFALDNGLSLVIHLMIAGRLRWHDDQRTPRQAGGRNALASFGFDVGTLTITEASTKKRASLHLVRDLGAHTRTGIDILETDLETFTSTLRTENHTLKRTLTDPRLFDGIGNAYSDEILHTARLSPFVRTANVSDKDAQRLFDAAQSTLTRWIDELSNKFKQGHTFPGPGQITAFRPGFAVHGKYDEPCPVCATPVQRVVYAENEMNYCPTCQTGGRILADRAFSRLLRDDWPRTVDELE